MADSRFLCCHSCLTFVKKRGGDAEREEESHYDHCHRKGSIEHGATGCTSTKIMRSVRGESVKIVEKGSSHVRLTGRTIWYGF
jgi:hypothetical protein